MRLLNQLAAAFSLALLLASAAPNLQARTKKGDRLLKQGRQAQLAEDWDKALELYEQALAEDPSDPAYQLAVRRTRFQASQQHLKRGKSLRDAGKLEEALAAFQRAYVIDPSSTIAEQEIRRTYRLIREQEEREKEGKKPPEEEEAFLSPTERLQKQAEQRAASILPVPELKPISRQLNTLRMNNQPVRLLFETIGKLAGINVIFDPEFQAPPRNFTVDLTNTTLEDALNYVATLTKTFWKPLSENTIFVTNDNVTKRRDYDEMVVQVFYLKNVTKVQELQEIATAVRSVTDIRRLFTYNSQNAILVRGTKDQVALAEKLIHDLDKPLAEVVVDVIVMEANRNRTRDLANAIVSGAGTGLSLPILFSPGGTPAPDGDGDGDTAAATTGIRLGDIGKLTENDWTTTLPGALLQALMTDRGTRILQRPQVRAADGQKASLRLGDRIPFATGSFQPGVGAVGVSPLVSTQFQFADVGVNVDLTPKIHGEEDVSLHIEIEISAVRDRIDIGGLSQPIIGQRKIIEDIRVREGEVTLLGGLSQDQRTRTTSGIPGLADIPIIKWLGFSSQSTERAEGELLIALIPYIVRRPDITELNLRGVAAGSDQTVQLRYAPPKAEQAPAPETPPARPEAPPPTPAPEAPEVPKPPAEAAPPAGPGLSFNPPAVKVRRGEIFTVSLVIENATDVFNAPMKFKFDPRFLRLNDVTRGGFLSRDGQQIIFTRNILNDSGDAAIILNRLPGAGGISGAGTLVTLTFQAVAQGATQVTIPDLTIRNSRMQALPVTAPALQVSVEEGQQQQ